MHSAQSPWGLRSRERRRTLQVRTFWYERQQWFDRLGLNYLPNPNFLETPLTVPFCPRERTSRRETNTGHIPSSLLTSPEPRTPPYKTNTTAHDVQGGARDWGNGGYRCLSFLPLSSSGGWRCHDVLGEKPNCRPVRNCSNLLAYLLWTLLWKAGTEAVMEMAETETVQSQFISPQGKKCDLKWREVSKTRLRLVNRTPVNTRYQVVQAGGNWNGLVGMDSRCKQCSLQLL